MSQIFECSRCGRRTTEPFLVGSVKLCTICAEWDDPEMVTRRERKNWKRYQDESGHPHKFRERFGIR